MSYDVCRALSVTSRNAGPKGASDRESFRVLRERTLRNPLFGGSRCLTSRRFSFATETTVGRGSTRVGAFKKRFETQESNIRRSSPDTAVRFRSCVEGPAISYSRRPGRRSCRLSNFPTAPSSAIPGRFWPGCASSRSEETRCTESRDGGPGSSGPPAFRYVYGRNCDGNWAMMPLLSMSAISSACACTLS